MEYLTAATWGLATLATVQAASRRGFQTATRRIWGVTAMHSSDTGGDAAHHPWVVTVVYTQSQSGHMSNAEFSGLRRTRGASDQRSARARGIIAARARAPEGGGLARASAGAEASTSRALHFYVMSRRAKGADSKARRRKAGDSSAAAQAGDRSAGIDQHVPLN